VVGGHVDALRVAQTAGGTGMATGESSPQSGVWSQAVRCNGGITYFFPEKGLIIRERRLMPVDDCEKLIRRFGVCYGPGSEGYYGGNRPRQIDPAG
jgi:hypothetical protein